MHSIEQGLWDRTCVSWYCRAFWAQVCLFTYRCVLGWPECCTSGWRTYIFEFWTRIPVFSSCTQILLASLLWYRLRTLWYRMRTGELFESSECKNDVFGQGCSFSSWCCCVSGWRALVDTCISDWEPHRVSSTNTLSKYGRGAWVSVCVVRPHFCQRSRIQFTEPRFTSCEGTALLSFVDMLSCVECMFSLWHVHARMGDHNIEATRHICNESARVSPNPIEMGISCGWASCMQSSTSRRLTHVQSVSLITQLIPSNGCAHFWQVDFVCYMKLWMHFGVCAGICPGDPAKNGGWRFWY